MTSEPPPVEVLDDGDVRLLSFNRPDRRNALNDALMNALGAALREVAENVNIRAVVLTGAGSAFCAGGDLAANGTADVSTAMHRHQRFVDVALALQRLPKPTVAAVNGAAIGGGLSLALTCDEVIVSATAKLAFTFLPVGLPPDLLSVHTVQRRAGWTVAADLFHSGRMFSPEEARTMRLVNDVVAGDVMPAALSRAHALAELPPIAFAATKSLLRAAWSSSDVVSDMEAACVASAVATDEFRAATQRFQKRR